jgi:hypothetical protein
MQTFIDTVTQKVWAFDDNVVVTDSAGVCTFTTVLGVVLAVPLTLQPYTVPAPTTAQLAAAAWATQQSLAQAALTESDKTILRCYENAVVVPTAWATYRKALRAIVGTATGDATIALPTKPAYPAGT